MNKIAACFMSFMLAASVQTQAQPQRASEYDVKAAYLLNFLKFVQWPASASGGAAIPICVLGHDPFGAALDKIVSSQAVDGKTVIARRLVKADRVDGCRILFIDSSEAQQLGNTFAALDDSPILTVAEMPDFVSRG